MFEIKINTRKFEGKIVSEGVEETAIDGYKIVDGMVARNSIPNGKNIKPLADKLNKKYKVFDKYFDLLKETKNDAVLSILRYCAKDGIQEERLKNDVVSPIKKAIKIMYFGNNKRKTIDNKGFNRPMFDTAGFWKSIILKIIK